MNQRPQNIYPKTSLMKMKTHTHQKHMRDVTISISNCQYLRRFSIVDMMVVYSKKEEPETIYHVEWFVFFFFVHHRKKLLSLFSNAINFLRHCDRWQNHFVCTLILFTCISQKNFGLDYSQTGEQKQTIFYSNPFPQFQSK